MSACLFPTFFNRCINRCSDISKAASVSLFFILLLGLSINVKSASSDADIAPVQLAKVYNINGAYEIDRYWVSEKLDGMRAYWNGKALLSRNGLPIFAPAWFVADFPNIPMDGELWIARDQFQLLISTVRKHQPVDEAWKKVRYMLFDLPAHNGNFDERVEALVDLIAVHDINWLKMIGQKKVSSIGELDTWLALVEAKKGEGLMLHLGSAKHRSGRSDALLKLKSHQDAEAIVIGYKEGKGKYVGKTGALLVESPEGQRFSLGSGLSDNQRENPPKIGSLVSYKYNGLTRSGKPRFPRFWRVRPVTTTEKQ
jgi:DNA ligase-1